MPEESPLKPNNLKLAIFSVVFAVFALSFGDAVIKNMSLRFTLWQIYVIRSVIAITVVLLIIKASRPPSSLIPHSTRWVLIRSLLLGLMWVAYYAALPHIKLSVAAAVYYTIPLFITLFSALFCGAKIKALSWFAIALGFLGVLVIVRPDIGGFNAFVLLPLIAAVLYALAMILTSTKCLHENPKVLSLWLNLIFVLMGGMATIVLFIWPPSDAAVNLNPFLLGDWAQLNTQGWLAMMALGIIAVIGTIFSAIAYQNGPPTVVASFDYAYLIFSVFWGFVFFAETPDALTLLGMALIAIAGLIAVRN